MMKIEPTRRQLLRALCLGGTAAATTSLVGCGGEGAESGSGAAAAGDPVQGGDLVIALSYEPDTLNVYATHLMGDVQAFAVEGLLVPNEHMEYIPVLAKEVPTVENGLIVLHDDDTMDITYNLREGVQWHDGSGELTSADVKATWVALANPDWTAESKQGVDEIDSIDTPDDYTVVCHYNRQTPDFAQCLFTFGIMPAHLIEGVDMNDPNGEYNSTMVGTGPYKFVEWVRGDHITLERNEDYWGEEGPYLDTITIRFVTDENTRINMLKSGEIDFTYGIGFANYPQVENIEGMVTVANPLNSWQYVDMNCSVPGLDDVNVRHAISCAIDKQTLVDELFHGIPTAWHQPWTVSDPYHVEDFVTEWDYDVDRAKQILDDAGWVEGSDGIREKDGVRLDFVVGCSSSSVTDEAIQQVLMDSLKEIGINLTAENYAASTWTAMMYDGDYQIGLGRFITSPGATRTKMYASDGALNRGRWSSPEFDEASHQLDREMDEETRKELVKKCLEAFDEGMPQVIIYSNAEVDVYTNALQGLKLNPTNMTNFCQSASMWLQQ